MRHRLEELENTVGWMTSVVANMEQDYYETVPNYRSFLQSNAVPQTPAQQTVSQVVYHHQHNSIIDWAINTGWPVLENANGIRSIFTDIKSFEHLREALKKTVQYVAGPHDDSDILTSPIKPVLLPFTFNKIDNNNKNNNNNNNNNKFEGVFDSLGRIAPPKTHSTDDTHETFNTERLLEQDIKTRIICQHHQCGFPTLVRPSRFIDHFLSDSLKPLVLSSVFSHSVPHCCIYHPRLVQLENDGRELGNKFYNYSHDLLGMEDDPTISNIHQRTFLITYDLDLGRVRRAFLHLGLAIRMCFLLDLHQPKGYMDCKTEFEREQRKRVFWTVWFYDTVIPHFFNDQVSTMRTNQISIDLPLVLPDFDQLETDQTRFARSLIEIRKLAVTLSEQSKKMAPKALVGQFRHVLWSFYHSNLSQRYGSPPIVNESLWQRRDYFCILLDYCQCWITLYRPLLPTSALPPSHTEYEAIIRTSQAAVAAIHLFEQWFQMSCNSEDGFDCFFRPYLYHFMNVKSIFSANVSESGRPQPLVYISRAYLVQLLHLYQNTPTRRSVEESQLEKDLIQILDKYNISINEVPYPKLVEEALMDDMNADGGFSIFSNPSATV
ncbi:hypothetical protein K501DRAFT_251592 [Backusella circina FSU 941]|nr:hypothetical protein K501DRAFT_251592 [Backusella circina FSU 941]